MICKICSHEPMKKVVDLGLQPLANKYPKNSNEIKNEKKFPLILIFCENCLNVQIEKLINRKEMFEDYYYLSSVNMGLVNHFESLAKKIDSSSFVVDIGSNDGILLKPLKAMGIKAIGVDPSINVGKIANDQGLETFIGFFSYKIVENIIKIHGKPDTVVASNIFTHIENPKQFVLNIKKLIEENGMFILEVEYLSKFIKNIQFERFYFDRPYYYSLNSIKKLVESANMSLVDVEFINVHGGSIRCFIKNSKNIKPSKLINKIINNEKKELTCEMFQIFEQKINKEVENFKKELMILSKLGKKVIGYGAPARVATITNFAKINKNLIEYIVDDNILKQNRHTPGTHIPIKSRKKSKNDNIDVVVVFAYEYFNEIKEKMKDFNCDFYSPIPFQIINY